MTGFPGFGARLARFLECRNLAASSFAAVSESELHEVLDGSPPSMVLLKRLAPELGMQVQDLLVLAGFEVPEELAPLEWLAGSTVVYLAYLSMPLPPDRRRELLELARSLPQEERSRPVKPPIPHDPGPGALLLALLHNRNLRSTAKALYVGTRGEMYLAESTVLGALAGRCKLKPLMFAGFCPLLGIPAIELAALTGFELPPNAKTWPEARVMPELVWELRRLSYDQAQDMQQTARSMAGEE